MPAPTYLALPHVLQLFRHDQGLSRQQMARLASMCPHCYEGIEAGRAPVSTSVLERLYVRLPVIGVLMADQPITLPVDLAPVAQRLGTVIRALESCDTETQQVELARIGLALQWRELDLVSTAESL